MSLTGKERAETFGWGLFVVSALFYAIASYRAGDAYGLIASVLFLFACCVFIGAVFGGAAKRSSLTQRTKNDAGLAHLRH
ncbi:hypothetical protein G5B40_19270 [Pikeienuella piscinae]|uniref:Uncharacterized protein n=1 Tax=Pikeienuella piscinae TaxID=2748098 RepID=A0A7M3T5W5_9RHOB|nr:hypothetical protein [Pikeienuella piscinae]QIE57396.1 hypothetical protein G5B40_19270 [Pikeienuella piscinae]